MSLKNASQFISLLGGGQAAGKKSREAEKLRELTCEHMPGHLQDQIQHVRILEDRLRITVASAAVATRIRFIGPQLLASLKKNSYTVNSVSVHVQPRETRQFAQRRTTAKPSPPTPSAIRSVESLAQDMEADKLQASLKRLSQAMKRATRKG